MEGPNMHQQQLISRRDLIASVPALAVAGALMPKIGLGDVLGKESFIVVNGWVLKRSDTA
jgi:hypothetical protein